MTEQLEHRVDFERGHDCTRFECVNDSATCKPGSGGFHGIHGLQIRFLSIGPKGAIQFVLSTGWLPQRTEPDGTHYRDFQVCAGDYNPMPMGLGYHAREPQYDGQDSMGACEYLDGADCYYDGSGRNANDAFYALLNGGGEGLWTFLDSMYACRFEDAPYPTPCEYPKPLRSTT